MSSIKSVVIIYNPKSTGNSEKNARDFAKKLKQEKIPVRCVPTEYAGHAKQLAKQYAERPTPTMIISSSGDGGYHEVVSGVLSSSNPRAVVGVLPSGNANDHYHYMHKGNTLRRIKNDDYQDIDVLQLEKGRKKYYAHSYIGLGMTPQIGEILTKNDLNIFKETWLVLKNIFSIRSVKIEVNGHTKRFDHLVFLNIGRMSKYLKVANCGTMHDGEFDIVSVKSGSFHQLILHLFTAASRGAIAEKHASRYEFKCLRGLKIQLDGEVISCREGDKVIITSQRKALRTIV